MKLRLHVRRPVSVNPGSWSRLHPPRPGKQAREPVCRFKTGILFVHKAQSLPELLA